MLDIDVNHHCKALASGKAHRFAIDDGLEIVPRRLRRAGVDFLSHESTPHGRACDERSPRLGCGPLLLCHHCQPPIVIDLYGSRTAAL
jgi:hypothetical protein